MYTAQYAQPNADMYESLDKCPDELLLFFHHVNYSHHLQSGKSVMQYIYDTYFDGVDQANHAQLWCDVINTYFYRESGIPDELGRKIY